MSDLIRIDRLLSQMGEGSRKEIRDMAKKGRIRLNGDIIKNVDGKIYPDKDIVSVDGREIVFAKYEYFMMNKPQGVVSATRDDFCRTVIDLITDNKRENLFPVGRLDKDTEGLLIITNDGEMAHRLLSPSKHVNKTYYAKIEGIVGEDDVEMFSKGILLADGTMTRSAHLKILSSAEISEIEVTIYEGKYHQVKRMFAACGKHVLYLKRIAMGKLWLDDKLVVGEYRRMTKEELRLLQNL